MAVDLTCDLWGLKGRIDVQPDIWGHFYKGYILPDIYSIDELIFQNPSFSLKICTALGFISYNSESDHKSKILKS